MVDFFVWLAKRIALGSPEFARDGRAFEIADTVRDACRRARRHGRHAVIFTGIAECWSLAQARLNPRVGNVRPPIVQQRTNHEGAWAQMIRTLQHDVRMAFRSLMSAKAMTAVALITLALGIGVNTTVFSVLDATIFTPVPFRDANRLASLVNYNPNQGFSYFGFSRELMHEWREQTDLFDRLEASDRGSFVLSENGGAELVNGATVTPGLFSLLGVNPARGRYFVAGDGRGGADRIVVVSDHFWRTHLAKRADAVGQSITLNGQLCRIVGVMPASFHYPQSLTELWLPFDVDAPPPSPVIAPRAFEPLVRLAPGVTPERANSEAIARGGRLSAAAGLPDRATAKLETPSRAWDTKTVQSLTALGGAVGFLMLIVCANLANLSLSRSLARARDYAVRSALGASRADIVRETLVENSLVGVGGVLLGVGVAWALQQLTVVMLPDALIASSVNAIDLDGRALAFTAAAGTLATVLFGLPPAVIASKTSFVDTMRLESRATTGARGARRWRSALVVTEVGLSVVLMTGAAVMARSVIKLQSEPRGFDSNGLVSMTIGLPAPAYSTDQARRQFSDGLMSSLRNQPGVSSVTSGGVPGSLGSVNAGMLEFGHQPGVRSSMTIVPAREVPLGYFEALRLPVLSGHAFRDTDAADAVIVSAAFANAHWPQGAAVGGRFRFASGPAGGPAGAWRTIVGVVGNVRALNDSKDAGLLLYYPQGHASAMLTVLAPSSTIAGFQTFVVRADNPGAFVRTMKDAVHRVDPAAVVWKTDFVDHLYDDAFARPRVVFLMIGTFAAFGLLLVAVGLYGALTHLVTQRLREIGIRSALGATRLEIARLVIGQSLMLTLSGLTAGLLLSMPLLRLMRSLLYEIETFDPLSIAAVSLLLIGVSLLATWKPARVAARVDPLSLLRQ